MSFKNYTLGEIASNTSRRFNFNNREQVCFVNTGDILDGHFLVDEKVSSIGLPGQAKKAIQKGDILYSEIRPGNKRHLLVKTDVDDYVVSTKFMVITCNQDIVVPEYLYLVLTSKECEAEFKVIADSRSGTFPQITFDAVAYYPIELPSLVQQRAVVEFIKSITGKLNLNKLTNQTLEQMAQAIFKSWFVDFEPVKAKMNGEQPEGMDEATASLFPEKLVSETGLPEGWKLSEIGDEVTVVGGGTPSKKNDDFWIDGHIHWTSPKDLSGVQDKVLLDTASKVTEAGLKKISSGLLPIDTVLLSSRAPVGYLALAKVPMAINQGYIAMKCEKLLPPEFVLQWCVHRMDEIKQRASGSTFAEISKKSFKPISVVVPTGEVLSAYQKLVKPLYDAITSNARQNEQLSSLRDTLLPKLLSGELVPSSMVEEV
ncbi:TPA: restriction endonuclease subunit S [Photobacterium damselae]